jgi:GNAT superfamily N-acetyltransferase
MPLKQNLAEWAKTIEVIPVTTAQHSEIVRQIRNAGYINLAHEARILSRRENEHFWEEQGAGIRAWIYKRAEPSGTVIGVGSLRERDGKTWAFVAVPPHLHGYGYGTHILRDITERSEIDVWAVTRDRNGPAMGIHKSMGGWEEVSREPAKDGAGEIVTQVYRKVPHG